MDLSLPVREPVLQFTILLVAALAMQLTVERARLPGLLGLLVIGVVLGPGGAGVLPQEPVVEMLGRIGLVYVMFIAGLEIDLGVVRQHWREVVGFGLLAFTLSAVPAVGAGLLLGFELAAALLLGALVSSHTLVAYPLLLRMGLLSRLAVITAVGGTLITDTLSLLLLAVVLALHAGGTAASGMLPLVLLAVLVGTSAAVVPWLARAAFTSERLTRAERALFALVTLLVLAAAARLAGTEEILGAFLAGLCLNRPLAEHTELREHLEFVGRMLFIPVLLIWTGTLLELDVLAGASHVWLVAAVLMGVLVIGKAAAAWITGARAGHDWADRFLMFGLTLPQAAATLAITITAQEVGLFTREVLDAVIVIIFASCLAGALITQQAGRMVQARHQDEGAGPPVQPPAD